MASKMDKRAGLCFRAHDPFAALATLSAARTTLRACATLACATLDHLGPLASDHLGPPWATLGHLGPE